MADNKVRVPSSFFEELVELFQKYKNSNGEWYGECNLSYTTELGNKIKGSVFPLDNGKIVIEIEVNQGD